MFKDLLLFRDGVFYSIVIWLFLCATAIAIFVGCDYGFGAAHEETALVTDKYHVPEYTQFTYISDGKGGGHMQMIYYPERWGLTMRWHNNDYDFDCSEYYFEISDVGKIQSVTIVSGAITGNYYSGSIIK